MQLRLLFLLLAFLFPLAGWAAAVERNAVVTGPTPLPSLAVNSGTATSYRVFYTRQAATGELYVGSTRLTGNTNVTVADAGELRFVPNAALTTATVLTFTYRATVSGANTAQVSYTLTIQPATRLSFAATPVTSWKGVEQQVTIGPAGNQVTVTGKNYSVTPATATAQTLQTGNTTGIPGPSLEWFNNYRNVNPGTNADNNSSEFTFAFSKAVYSLSVVLTDIDMNSSAANDFLDRITFLAYNNASSGSLLAASQVEMATGASNARVAGTTTVEGTANNDAGANTAFEDDGTVIVRFNAPVERLVIVYKNAYTPYTANRDRNQGVGIAMLSWDASAAPLPVKLTAFDVLAQGQAALLTWATAQEENNKQFEIERSTDGYQFSTIGQVAGRGNSAGPQHYRFVTDLTGPLSYYRLRQVDADGTASYSPVRVLRSSQPQEQPTLYPLPATAAAFLDLRRQPAGTGAAQLLSNDGRTVRRYPVLSGQLNELSLEGIPAGSYVLRLTGLPGSHKALRIVKE